MQLGTHAKHTVVSVGDFHSQLRNLLRDKVGFAQEDALPAFEKSVSEVEKEIDGVNKQVEEASKQMNELVEKLVSILKEEQKRLRDDLDKIRWKKLHVLEIQLAKLKEEKERVERAVCFGEKALTNLNAQQFAQVASWALKHLTVDKSNEDACTTTFFEANRKFLRGS